MYLLLLQLKGILVRASGLLNDVAVVLHSSVVARLRDKSRLIYCRYIMCDVVMNLNA